MPPPMPVAQEADTPPPPLPLPLPPPLPFPLPPPPLSALGETAGALPDCPFPTWTVMVAPLGASHGVTLTTLLRGPGTSSRFTVNPCFSRSSRVWSNVGPFGTTSHRALTTGPVRVGRGVALLFAAVGVVPPAAGLLPPPWVSAQTVTTPPSSTSTPTSTPRMISGARPPNSPPGRGGCPGR